MKSYLRAVLGREKAFTLIELLIVIAIIAILTVAFLPTALKAPARARDAGRIKTLSDIQAAVEGFIASHNGAYPTPPAAASPANAGVTIDVLSTTLGITIPTTVPATTYYYYNGSSLVPAFYAIGFVPENSANANSSATTAIFTAAGKITGEFPTDTTVLTATSMRVAKGPL